LHSGSNSTTLLARQERDQQVGINLCEATAILSLKRSGAVNRSILSLGRPELFVNARDLATLSTAFRYDWTPSWLASIAAETHAEEFLTAAGFTDIRSLDASGYEGATIIHDLNLPLPASAVETVDFVYDGGTLEHVFDIATALRNVTQLLTVDGTLLISGAANNQCGHGFYQFSPELFYRYLEANGFVDIRVYLVGLLTPNRWRRVADPKVLGRRVQVMTAEPTQIIVMARKSVALAQAVVPQQSDYSEQNWRKSEAELAQVHAQRTSLAGDLRQVAKVRGLFPAMAAVRNFGGPGFPGLYQSRHFSPVDPLKSML
jgi:SAM-dependent methyltransferase